MATMVEIQHFLRNVWGPPWWGHVASEDLAHWWRLPPALVPDTWYDGDGVFSGSATVLDDGTPILFYTGVSKRLEYGYYYQVQATARPSDPISTSYVRWTKDKHNPIIEEVPRGGIHSEFRDPTRAWKVQRALLFPNETTSANDPVWVVAVGAQVDCVGAAVLYATDDFASWRHVGKLYSQEGVLPRPGGQCDQFGSVTRAWECPDFFEVPVLGAGAESEAGATVKVFKYSDQDKSRVPFAKDWYVLSDGVLQYGDGNQLQGAGIFQANVGGVRRQPKQLDYGTVYASKTFQKDDRVIWQGWVYETAPGCNETCIEGSSYTDELGFQGALTLPREITYDPEFQDILLNPIPELSALRESLLFNGTTKVTSSTETTLEMKGPPQLEIVARLSLASSSSSARRGRKAIDVDHNGALPFMIGLKIFNEGGDEVLIECSGLLSWASEAGNNASGNQLKAHSVDVYVDQPATRSNKPRSRLSRQGGPVDLGHGGSSTIELHAFLDRSVLEVYSQGGRARVTSRVYPEQADTPWKVAVFSHGKRGRTEGPDVQADVTVWSISNCWIDPPSIPRNT